MIATLGRTLIHLSLLVATTGTIVAFAAGKSRSELGALWARRCVFAFAALMIAANALMVYALLTHDFSVGYVAQVGSRSTPTWVTIVSLWSSLEGSILFWELVLAVYLTVTTWLYRNEHPEYMSWAIGVWLACAAFFSFLIAAPAQPFFPVPNPPADGPGPNPLLQNHILMAIHPPMLYLGYVGMTIPFGLASAALLAGKLGHDFLKTLRRWLLIPWIFLSIAIVLGGRWAYEVLGWGGYWAWDPVENASFLPWLTATAAIHSALVMERKAILRGWTVTLILSTFLLTILGTFMTRSGVFNSVHSFTQSEIGPTLLVFLAAALFWSVVLLALRIDRLAGDGTIDGIASRETVFLLNNLVFILFTFTILVGTVFPLVVEAIKGTQMSVGRPYFDKMAIPIGVSLLFLMGVGPALPWGRATNEQIRHALLPPVGGGVVMAAIGLALGVRNPWTLLTLGFGGYALYVTLREIVIPVNQRRQAYSESLLTALSQSLWHRGRRRFGAYVAHLGAIAIIVSIAVSSTMQTSIETQLKRGESARVGDYTLTFQGAEQRSEPHRESIIAKVSVSRDGQLVKTLTPRMNFYRNQREPIGTPDVLTSPTRDLYLSAMNIDPESQTLGLLAIVKPMVGLIWIATAFIAVGAAVTLIPLNSSRAILRTAPAVELTPHPDTIAETPR